MTTFDHVIRWMMLIIIIFVVVTNELQRRTINTLMERISYLEQTKWDGSHFYPPNGTRHVHEFFGNRFDSNRAVSPNKNRSD